MAAAAPSSQSRRIADMLFEDSQMETAAAAAAQVDVQKARHEYKSIEEIKELILLQNSSMSEVMKMTMMATQALAQLATIMTNTAVKPEGVNVSQQVPGVQAAMPISQIGYVTTGVEAMGAAPPQQQQHHHQGPGQMNDAQKTLKNIP